MAAPPECHLGLVRYGLYGHARVRRTAAIKRRELQCQCCWVPRSWSVIADGQMDFGAARIHQTRADRQGRRPEMSVRRIADPANLGEACHSVGTDNPASEIDQRTLRCRIGEV